MSAAKKKATKKVARKARTTDPVATAAIADIDQISEVYDNDTNPNRMDAESFELLKASIQTAGFLQPILVRADGKALRIVDGHHRFRAARELSFTKIPVVITDADVHRAASIGIGMNRLRGELDISRAVDVLREVQEATEWTADELSALAGFSSDEIKMLVLEPASSHVLLEDVVGAASASDDDDSDGAPRDKLYVLEIEFSDRDEYKLARRKLRRAAGKGNPMSVGLMALLGEDQQND